MHRSTDPASALGLERAVHYNGIMTTTPVPVLRLRAFTTDPDRPDSGNPAGVVLDADDMSDAEMLRIAADVGYSETAFLSAITPSSARIRYFSPRVEIAFCGHATIASGTVLAARGADAVVTLTTNAGPVPVEATPHAATLTAVESTVEPLPEDTLAELLDALRLTEADLDPALPPALLLGGNPHPVVFVHREALTRLDHDGPALLALQDRRGWDGTTPVVHRVDARTFASRNPFPRGGIREDPATGSSAAALGEYLRHGGHVDLPTTVTVHQGAEIGRPSTIAVAIPATGRIRVTGSVVAITG